MFYKYEMTGAGAQHGGVVVKAEVRRGLSDGDRRPPAVALAL